MAHKKYSWPLANLLSNYWLYGILFVLIIAAYSFNKTVERYHIVQSAPLANDLPRLLMYKVKSTQYNTDGNIEQTITADGLAQFSDNRISAVNPQIILFDNDQPQTTLSGQRAEMYKEIIRFDSEVTLTSISPSAKLSGDSLEYNKKTATVEVINPRLSWYNNTISILSTAKKLVLNLNDQTMQLDQLVQTHITESAR